MIQFNFQLFQFFNSTVNLRIHDDDDGGDVNDDQLINQSMMMMIKLPQARSAVCCLYLDSQRRTAEQLAQDCEEVASRMMGAI